MTFRVAFVILFAARAAAAADLSIPCERGRVELGSRTIDLLGRCGRPALAVTEREERGTRSTSRDHRKQAERTVTVVIDHWTYDFGPSQFLYLVTLEGGKVTRIEQGPYGTSTVGTRAQAALIPRAGCTGNSFREGESAYELLARCGDPAVRDVRDETRTEAVRNGPHDEESITRTLTTEVWTYDLGPKQFVRFVLIEDGRVVRLETGGYGYSQL
jgi:hypothetical protein